MLLPFIGDYCWRTTMFFVIQDNNMLAFYLKVLKIYILCMLHFNALMSTTSYFFHRLFLFIC